MANTNTEIIAMLETNPSQAIRGVLDTLYLYNPAPVNELIAQLNEALKKVGFEALVLDSLPETGKSGTIYFVPSGGETPNVYNEYVWVAETEKFEMVGSAQVDLSNYYTKDEVDDQLIDIVGYVGDETRPLRNDLNQLNKNIIKVADWVNAKDEEGNRAVLETEAQDAYRAINELNQKIGSGGAGLPDQTGNAGKFLTTDGTTAGWGEALVNKSTNYPNSAMIIGGEEVSQWTSAAVLVSGATGKVTSGATAIGAHAQALGADSIAIGRYAKTSTNCIQLDCSGSTVSNNDANTFKVSNENSNYEIMSADGTIPTDRYTTTPATAGTYVPKLTIAEDGTATREWGTASGGGVSGDYLPLSGGTLTGELGLKHPGKAYETKIYMAENGVLHFQSAFEVRFYNTLFPNSSTAYNAPTLGLYSNPWKEGYISKLHTKKLNNGADLIVPTEGGTLARLEDLEDVVTIKEYD